MLQRVGGVLEGDRGGDVFLKPACSVGREVKGVAELDRIRLPYTGCAQIPERTRDGRPGSGLVVRAVEPEAVPQRKSTAADREMSARGIVIQKGPRPEPLGYWVCLGHRDSHGKDESGDKNENHRPTIGLLHPSQSALPGVIPRRGVADRHALRASRTAAPGARLNASLTAVVIDTTRD